MTEKITVASKLDEFRSFVRRSALAGFLIGVACYGSLIVQRLAPGGVGSVVGAFLFAFGLYAILALNGNLYTSRIGSARGLRDVGACLCMLAINVAGAAFVAALIGSAFIVNPSDALAFSEQSADVVRGKAPGLANAFYSAIPCGALVRVSGEIYRKTGRFVDMAVPVAVFVLCGFRHCVVEAFYFTPLAVVIAVAVGNGVGAMFVDLCIKGKTTLEPSSARRTF